MSKNSMTEISPNRAKLAVLACAKSRRSVFLWGPPGIGKSDIVRQVADFLGENVHGKPGSVPVYDVRLLLLDPTDLRGIPYRDPLTNKMCWSEPSILPPEMVQNPAWTPDSAPSVPKMIKNEEWCVLFLDELTAAPPSVQAAAYQLVLDRRIGDYHLPDNTLVVAAGNRTTDRGVAYKMPTPLANRFVHVDMKADADDWLDWAMQNGVHPNVVSYISEKKGKLHDFNPTTEGADRAFPTPRSWAFVSDMLWNGDADTRTLKTLIQGTVGQGVATEFLAWLDTHKDVPKAVDIITGKDYKWKNTGISAQYYITASLCYEMNMFNQQHQAGDLKAAKNKTADETFQDYTSNLSTFILNHLNKELQIMAFRTMIKVHKIEFSRKNPEFNAWIRQNASLIISAAP